MQRAVPVVAAYHIPLRDCSQYSAGGAQSDAAYRAWIAALAKGLGSSKAVVILEPDALANLPYEVIVSGMRSGTRHPACPGGCRQSSGLLPQRLEFE